MFTMKCTPVFIILCWVVLFNAQSYNISGVVKNSAGIGIEGATVRLGKVNISTTTGTGGNFTLTRTSMVPFLSVVVSNMQCPAVLRDGKLSIVAEKQGEIRVMVYDCKGRLRISIREIVSPGNTVLSIPPFANGLYIYNITLEGKQYSFKSIAGLSVNSGRVTANQINASSKLGKMAAGINDMLLASKNGYQLYRLSINSPDTSGIQITLIPLEIGTVTDIDGIVYRTVKIGNQVWTMENIRTTRYNDGTPISYVSYNSGWDSTLQGAYCFYNYSTDPAFQQKWGALYNWFAASWKLAPAGWRVPNDADWDSLQYYLRANGYTNDGTPGRGSVVKSLAAETDWTADSTFMAVGNDLSKNNTSGFSGLPGGCCLPSGTFNNMDTTGYWWTTDLYTPNTAVYRCFSYKDNHPEISKSPASKYSGLSIRLVADYDIRKEQREIAIKQYVDSAIRTRSVADSLIKAATILPAAQQAYIDMKFGMFVHFNMSTFDRCCCSECRSVSGEWGYAASNSVVADKFRPSKLDIGQWARVAKSAGMNYMVLTTKYHDGFCIWPSRWNDHNVKYSSWAGGNRDVLREYVDTLTKYGIKIGFYYSIWDKTQGTNIAFVKAQLTELLMNYGPVTGLHFDGWGWVVGHNRVPYDTIKNLIKTLQPDCLIMENNDYYAMKNTEIVTYEMPVDGPPKESNTLPSEAWQTIRLDNCWFWHPDEQCNIKSAQGIVDELTMSSSRNAIYLLDLTPDALGLLPQCNVDRMAEVGLLRGVTVP